MLSDCLENIPRNQDIFIDANIFIYGLQNQSNQCHLLLSRCAKEEVFGVTSLEVVNEVTHRLMVAEAMSKKELSAKKINATYLKDHPEAVKNLSIYWANIEAILGMNILILRLEEALLNKAQIVRNSYGFLTNDSCITALMLEFGLDKIATNDKQFESVSDFMRYYPTDISSN
jgi:predicted nucleic acid-binding protein